MMERFMNANAECIVLARRGETALIVRPDNELTPFIVPLQHIEGNSDWWQGKYFNNFEGAYSHYISATNGRLSVQLENEVEYAKGSNSPREMLYRAHGRIDMAHELGFISTDDYLRLNHECVCDGINNPKYFD